jgi:hypothetical protein
MIAMYYNDHSPPHFHAKYGEYETRIAIESLEIVRGQIPRRALALVLEWAAIHRVELQANWRRAQRGEPLRRIKPLE